MWASDSQVYGDYLRLEHKQIRKVVEEIEIAILDPNRIPVDSRVAIKLGQLRELLVRHFEQEEAGGCLEQAACCCPRLSQAVTRISAEHQSLLRRMNLLIDAVQGGLVAADAGDFSQMLADFTQRLDAHDAAENDVLQEAFGNG